ncbi:hypothetical protein ACXR0O_00435 [Verrucomicrobiota bacterium sgz303538]
MSESDSSPSRLSAFEEVEIRINDIDTMQSEEMLREALKPLNGVRAARITRGGVVISFNPLGISVEQICQEIGRAGFTVDGFETGHRSPERRGMKATGKEIWRA